MVALCNWWRTLPARKSSRFGAMSGTRMAEDLDKILEDGEPDRMVVRINSGGGSAYTGFEIANRLRGIETHVVTRNESAAMSAAAVIFLAGDEREVGSMGTSQPCFTMPEDSSTYWNSGR